MKGVRRTELLGVDTTSMIRPRKRFVGSTMLAGKLVTLEMTWLDTRILAPFAYFGDDAAVGEVLCGKPVSLACGSGV